MKQIKFITLLLLLSYCKTTFAQSYSYVCMTTENDRYIMTAELDDALSITKIKYKTSNQWIKLVVKIPERDLPVQSCAPTETIYNEVINNKITGTYRLFKCGVNMNVTYRKKGSKKAVTFFMISTDEIKDTPCY